jgi:hypothetical protein
MLELISGIILICVLYGAVSMWHVFHSHRLSVLGDTVLLL